MEVNMDRRRDKQATKFRPAPSITQQEQPKQGHKKTKDSPKGSRDSAVSQDTHGLAAVPLMQDARKLDVYHQQFEGVVPGVISNSRPPGYVADPRHLNVAPGVKLGEHAGLKRERDTSPSGEPPPHSTKSSSLSRDISPSRITAQVQSAMQESSQPLLLSALQGKMPVPMMRGVSPKTEIQVDTKAGVVRQTEPSVVRSSPYPAEMRHSPVQFDSQALAQPREVSAQMVQTTTPFQHLMGALAAAREMSTSRVQPGSHHGGRVVPPNNHQQPDARNRTPSPKPASTSPKPVSATRSPQRNVSQPQQQQQQQRRSPVAPGTRVSPSNMQEMMAAATVAGMMPPGMMNQILPQHRGLVQQHLLASTLTTTGSIITTASPAVNTQPTRAPFSAAASRPAPIPPAPAVQSSGQSTIRLSTIPLNSSATTTTTTAAAAHREKSHHVHGVAGTHSVGTGTESKQYASQGAQTKHVPGLVSGAETSDSGVGGNTLVPPAHQPFHQRHSPTSHFKEVQGAGQRHSPSHSAARVPSPHSVTDSRMRTSPVCLAGAGHAVAPPLAHAQGGAVGKTFTSASSAVDLSRLQAATVVERKRRSPSPTPAHGNKPIPVPSHSHVHYAHPIPRHVAPVTSSTAAPSVSPVNHVTVAPILQPVVNLCRLPVTTDQSVRPKQETKPAAGSSVGRGAVSAQYQPKHHVNQNSQPVHTITSQSVEPGPIVKDFVPVAGSPEPHPFHQPPLPPHINPFTFPTTGIKIHYHSEDGPSYTLSGLQKDMVTSATQDQRGIVPNRSVSDITGLKQHSQRDQNAAEVDDMPRLMPEHMRTATSLASTFNHIEGPCPDGKERLMNPFNMRLQNLSNFPAINTTYRSAYRSHSVALQRAKACSITSAAKSLDLLRQNIQKSINKELDQVVQKYVAKFFQPAAVNIRLNNGANSVSEEHINAVCRQIFEEAKRMYPTEIRRSATPLGEIPDNISETGSINGTGRRVSPNPLKRSKVSDSDSEKGSDGGFPKKVVKRKGRPPLHASGRSTPLKPIKSGDQVRREGPKWDPDRIKPDTLFVMGARANKALGLGNTRGRLYIRHPDVFKYSGDQDDKVWLHEQKLMPATGGKAYMLIVEDIVDLSKTEEYRDSPTLMMHECRGFQVPEWMLVKIKEQMRSMRSDAKHSRSHSPVAGRPEPPKTLPFSTFSDTASVNDLDSVGNKNSLQPSPADTEEMEFLSAADNDDTQPADTSPFGMTGGFEDGGSPASCHLDSIDDSPVATPFS